MRFKIYFVSKRSVIFLSIIFCLAFFVRSRAAVCNSLYSGDWLNGTWSCGLPNCGDTIVIQPSHTVTINSQQDYMSCSQPMCIVIYGTLQFVNGNKLRLPCGSVIQVMAGGSIQPGSGGGNSNYIEICNNISWSAGNGPLYGPSCVGCVPLGVELVNFKAATQKNKVELQWITASEKDVDHFEIERSKNAFDFIPAIIEHSKSENGTSSSELIYLTADEQPYLPECYYRLKEVAKNGTASYSRIVYVDTRRNTNGIHMYPNPNAGNFIIQFENSAELKNVDVQVSDPTGKLIYFYSFPNEERVHNEINIGLKDVLKPGIYFCAVIISGEEFHSKMVIQ